MLMATALLWTLAAPQHAAPDDDPVRVALYGRPEEPTLSDLASAPAAHVGRAVRVSGRFEQVRPGAYQMCHEGACLRLLPEEGLGAVLDSRASRWMGQELQVTGVVVRERVAGAAAEGAPIAIRFWRLRAARTPDVPPLPGTPITLEALLYARGTRDGQLVRVQGRFRGRNLHADLPTGSQRGRGDWVVKDDYYAAWVTGRGPQGSGWKLDPLSMQDTRTWIEISGRPETRNGFVYLRAEQVAPLVAPVAAEAVAPPPAARVTRTTPPVVVLALPLEAEELAAREARVLVQFSTQMDSTSFSGRVRLRYAGEESPFDPARFTYDAARRTLMVETGALAAGREVECLLMEGLIDVRGQALVPRQGPVVDGVVEALRYRVASGAGSPEG
jgi:hypothetical protein